MEVEQPTNENHENFIRNIMPKRLELLNDLLQNMIQIYEHSLEHPENMQKIIREESQKAHELIPSFLKDFQNIETFVLKYLKKMSQNQGIAEQVHTMCIGLINSAIQDTIQFESMFAIHYEIRASNIANIQAHPNIKEYQLQVQAIDENMLLDIAHAWRDLRNYYLGIFQFITQNWKMIFYIENEDFQLAYT